MEFSASGFIEGRGARESDFPRRFCWGKEYVSGTAVLHLGVEGRSSRDLHQPVLEVSGSGD